MILIIILTLGALAIVGAVIYGVQKRKKNVPLAVVPTTVPQAEIQQLVTKLKEEPKAQSVKPVKVSGKSKKQSTKVTKTK
jgi:hypothetical protein